LQSSDYSGLRKERIIKRLPTAKRGSVVAAAATPTTPAVDLTILPTAGGKTLLFTALACLEEDVRVTIVVVPFRKLIDETVREA
jgi:superfamily II DNA helicase RecQ